MRRALVAVGLAACATRAEATFGGCPSLELSEYNAEPSPFGWPLTPNEWSFTAQDEWHKKYMLCGGLRQSPMDITLADAACGIDQDNFTETLKNAAKYVSTATGFRPMVKVSSYLRTVFVEGNFGSLMLKNESGQDVEFEAIQIHLTSGSLHSVDGKYYDAEMQIFHKPKSDKNMLKRGVILSILFSHGGESAIFNQMGFGQDTELSGRSWRSAQGVDLPGATASALEGASYMYNGSVPVPPCSETVTYIVLSRGQSVSELQTTRLKEALNCYAGGTVKRAAIPNPSKGVCRMIVEDALYLGGNHTAATCSSAKSKGEEWMSAACWDTGMSANRTSECVQSPIDISPLVANMSGPGGAPIYNFRRVRMTQVEPSKYTLDAVPLASGIPGPWANFGDIIVRGRTFLLRKISVKAVSSHTYAGVHHAGEIQIEAIMFGDEWKLHDDEVKLNDTYVNGTASPLNRSTLHRRLSAGSADSFHSVVLSIPIKIGAEGKLLSQLGLPSQAYKQAIKDMLPYTIETTVDLQDGIQQALDGPWLWYAGGKTLPGCPAWGVRYILYQTPVEASIAQLNFLSLKVSGMDSTRVHPLNLTEKQYAERVFSMGLPMFAASKNSNCTNKSWNYEDEHCWAVKHPTCKTGTSQSPINIITSEIKQVGTDNFLSKCSWRPVGGLHVANTGYGLQITNEQLGYITMGGPDGFPVYYQGAELHMHMPSEHMVDGRQFAAELHITHKRQESVSQEKNSLNAFPLVVTAFFFDIGNASSNFLDNLHLPEISIAQNTFLTTKYPVDLMRSFGPAIDGNFYRYDGSFTTPDCNEQVKWFIFEHVFSMSFEQLAAFKAMYPNPSNNRPVQPINGRTVAKNSMMDFPQAHYDFYLGRHTARDRFMPGEGKIAIPILLVVLLAIVVMLATFVREGRLKLEGSGGLTETIGRKAYNRM